MAPYLLDTDTIIDYLAGIGSTIGLVQSLHQRGDSLCTCDVVVAEVYSGLRNQDEDKAQPLLDALSYLPTSREAAGQAGKWRYAFARQGKALATSDVLVAATALFYGATIVTGNKDHYPMPEVTVLPLPRVSKQ